MTEPSASPYADPFAEGWASWESGGGNPYESGSEDAEEWDAGRESGAAFHGAVNAA
jgi:hypothetical protein